MLHILISALAVCLKRRLYAMMLSICLSVRLLADRGVEYVFSLKARNALDYGEAATQSVITPEGSESRNLIGGHDATPSFHTTDDSQ